MHGLWDRIGLYLANLFWAMPGLWLAYVNIYRNQFVDARAKVRVGVRVIYSSTNATCRGNCPYA